MLWNLLPYIRVINVNTIPRDFSKELGVDRKWKRARILVDFDYFLIFFRGELSYTMKLVRYLHIILYMLSVSVYTLQENVDFNCTVWFILARHDNGGCRPVCLKIEIHQNLRNPVPINRKPSSATKSTSMDRKLIIEIQGQF